jgi:hypothetical protein
MSFRVGNVAVVVPEPERKCELCGKQAECRPYGPRGEQICYDCAMKDEKTTNRQLARVLLGKTTQ